MEMILNDTSNSMQVKFFGWRWRTWTWLFQAAEVKGSRNRGGRGSGQKGSLANRPSTPILGPSRGRKGL